MAGWRPRLIREAGCLPYRPWLTEAGSLTARCQAACRTFRIRVLFQGCRRPSAEEAWCLGEPDRRFAACREVLLECDGVPVIFAHTVLPAVPRGRMGRWLAGLGSRSLGSLLFSRPGFVRSEIEFLRLDTRHLLFRRAAAAVGALPVAYLWARRSTHRLGNQAVLVTEIFLPAIYRLSHG